MQQPKEQFPTAQPFDALALARRSPLPVQLPWDAHCFASLSADCADLSWDAERRLWRMWWPPAAIVEIRTDALDALRPAAYRCYLYLTGPRGTTAVHALWWCDRDGPVYLVTTEQMRGVYRRLKCPKTLESISAVALRDGGPVSRVYLDSLAVPLCR